MSLDLVVGALVGYEQRNPEGSKRLQNQFDAISRFLTQFGLPQYREPNNCDVLSVRVGPHSYLHQLRRMAAHIAFRDELPPPSTNDPADDPILKQYIDRLFSEHKIGPFDHLIVHSDSSDYYIPLEFDSIVPPPPKDLGIDCWVIGSSISLLRECEYIATYLQLPLNNYKIVMGHLGTQNEQESKGAAEKWREYPIESHTCACLILACRRSIRTGAALLFA